MKLPRNTQTAILCLASPSKVSEAAFMRLVIETAELHGWLVYHTHDSRRSQAGFPDLVLVRNGVMYVELKSEKGKLSYEQAVWSEALVSAGETVCVWRPSMWREVRKMLEDNR